MTQSKELESLLAEFERVGVDPNTVSAGLAIPPDELLSALRQLPDGAGPGAFLHELRLLVHRDNESSDGAGA